jgi:D-glycero-D-manno-heptose 1,7-bisphosphate phosphatase
LNPPAAAHRAVFLVRDGTLMEEVEYCGDPAKVRLFAGVTPALLRLKSLGFRLVIVTNQSGIGRGYFAEDDFQRVQTELLRQLGTSGLIDATYHCPDAPEHAGNRRKPAPGMILEACADLLIDPANSFIIGDTCADIVCGQRAGLVGTILVLTGHSSKIHGECEPDHIAPDLAAAVDWIANQISHHG